MKLLIATTNPHKLREMKAFFSAVHTLELFSFLDFPAYCPPEEIGTSFIENASIKAIHAAKTFRIWTLADDSGLSVPALGHAPGIFSARYAGVGASDKDNRKKLLVEMEGLQGEGRSAYFTCAMVLANSAGNIAYTSVGRSEGEILDRERGGGGFGYDPLFRKHGYQQTYAELPEETKNLISHRGKAAARMKLYLERVS